MREQLGVKWKYSIQEFFFKQLKTSIVITTIQYNIKKNNCVKVQYFDRYMYAVMYFNFGIKIESSPKLVVNELDI